MPFKQYYPKIFNLLELHRFLPYSLGNRYLQPVCPEKDVIMGLLDLTAIRKAVASLTAAIKDSKDETFISLLQPSQKLLIMSGVIQNFEFTYELSWKFIKRWLEHNLGSSHVDGVTRRELFRLAAEHQLISSVDDWMFFHQARNQTSHTYDEKTAREICLAAEKFLPLAQVLLNRLEEKND
jgi:nucleotidyltransferase substrate binding protein (TIGR01987 family)